MWCQTASIPSVLNLDMRPNDRSQPKKILTVARLDLHKGHDCVLEALALVKSNGLGFEYIIAGEGDEESRLTKNLEKIGP